MKNKEPYDPGHWRSNSVCPEDGCPIEAKSTDLLIGEGSDEERNSQP
jgi:hypothetical protein